MRAMLLVMAFSWVAKELMVDWTELRSFLSALWPELRVEILVSSIDVVVFSDIMLFLELKVTYMSKFEGIFRRFSCSYRAHEGVTTWAWRTSAMRMR